MDSLPSELLHKIFIQVPFKDRLECTLVCRYWYNSLSNDCLLHDIEIKSDKSFSEFMNMLKSLPDRASQVEILFLKISSAVDKRILCNVLPNLRLFDYSDNSFSNQQENHCSQPLELIHPNSRLEMIEDEKECELTRQLLMFGSCAHLERLTLSPSGIANLRTDLFVHLKNAPALKQLILYYSTVGIQDLEVIHENVPTLEVLALGSLTLVPHELPRDIMPATSVATLQMAMMEVQDDPPYLDWYTYLGEKYTKMTSFRYWDSDLFNLDSIKNMKRYRDGLFPIYNKLGISLPRFDFADIPTESNPFHTFDEFDIRVSEIILENSGTGPIFEQLAASPQSKYTESIILENTDIPSPIMLQNFTSLREIRVNSLTECFRWNGNLSDYFNAVPPTLVTFAGHFKDAIINELPSHPNNIQNLSLACNIIYPKLGEAISTCFPKLNSVNLKGDVEENLNIYLPNNKLNHLDIHIDSDSYSSHGFSIMNSSISQPEYYIRRGVDQNLELATCEEIQSRVIISISYYTTRYLCCDDLEFGSSVFKKDVD